MAAANGDQLDTKRTLAPRQGCKMNETPAPWKRFSVYWDFPGGPAAKTPYSQCRGLRFNPWLRN